MAKKYDFWGAVDCDSELEKICLTKEKEIFTLEAGKAEVHKKMEALKPSLWQSYQDFQRASIVGDADTMERFNIYRKLLTDKNNLDRGLYQKIEGKKSELSVLISPLKTAASEALQREIQGLGKLYVMRSPVARVNASGKEVSIARREIESNQAFLDVESNGWALQLMKKILIGALGEIAREWSLTGLRKILENISKNLNSIDLKPVKEAIRIEDFENLNRPQSFEWGYFSEEGVKKINTNAKESRSMFDPDGTLLPGRNPW